MNSMQVKDKLKNISKKKNIPFNMALKFYIFDRFLVRLASSKYKDNLKEAIKNTFNQRQFKSDLLETFKIINESTIISKRWEIYASRYDYAKEIKYEYIMNCLKEIVYLLEPVAVHT